MPMIADAGPNSSRQRCIGLRSGYMRCVRRNHAKRLTGPHFLACQEKSREKLSPFKYHMFSAYLNFERSYQNCGPVNLWRFSVRRCVWKDEWITRYLATGIFGFFLSESSKYKFGHRVREKKKKRFWAGRYCHILLVGSGLTLTANSARGNISPHNKWVRQVRKAGWRDAHVFLLSVSLHNIHTTSAGKYPHE